MVRKRYVALILPSGGAPLMVRPASGTACILLRMLSHSVCISQNPFAGLAAFSHPGEKKSPIEHSIESG